MEWKITDNKSFLDKIKGFFFGKTIGFMGTDNVGKSTIWKYMLTAKINGKLSSTDFVDQERGKVLKIQEKDSSEKIIRIKIASDVGGQSSFHESKKKVFKESDYIIYVIRSDIFLNKNLDYKTTLNSSKKDERRKTINAVKNDFESFQKWNEDFNENSRFIIVGNYFGDFSDFSHSDFKNNDRNIPIHDAYLKKSGVPNFLDINYKNKYDRKFRQSISQVVGEDNDKFKQARWSVGSIVTESLAKQLALDILSNFG